ncbi:hypothetical protein CPB84DRAFT_1843730 [Gymnopilus junonius]|uniref:Uncharacterized protein n=1 Tax=Gymnopilus junonius TaxID=109634 RepID=A0A9P5TS16_GYMJU|nr:hypothetical protein CPB84DRAFT_1843730 [Gymnopilus junonius]
MSNFPDPTGGPMIHLNPVSPTELNLSFTHLCGVEIIWDNITQAQINNLHVDECLEFIKCAYCLSHLELLDILEPLEDIFLIPVSPIKHNELISLDSHVSGVDSGPLGIFFNSITLPLLKNLKIYMTELQTEILLPFLKHSACHIIEFHYERIEIEVEEEEEIMALLELMLFLQHLKLKPAPWKGHSIGNILHHLAVTYIQDDINDPNGHFLPNLELFHYLSGRKFSWDLLVDTFGPCSELKNVHYWPLKDVLIEFKPYGDLCKDYICLNLMDHTHIFSFISIRGVGIKVDISYTDPDSCKTFDLYQFMTRPVKHYPNTTGIELTSPSVSEAE